VWIALIAPLLAQQPASPTRPATAPPAKDALRNETFDATVADALFGRIGEGIAGHDRKLLLSAFDKQKFPHYDELKSMIDIWMKRNSHFMVHYSVVSSATTEHAGTATARFEVEARPSDPDFPPSRRTTEAKITAERGKDGWRVTSLDPENF